MNLDKKNKFCIIDNRMEDIYKEYFISLGYYLIHIYSQDIMYNEISSHPDIYFFFE